jgi:hypothetical protein
MAHIDPADAVDGRRPMKRRVGTRRPSPRRNASLVELQALREIIGGADLLDVTSPNGERWLLVQASPWLLQFLELFEAEIDDYDHCDDEPSGAARLVWAQTVQRALARQRRAVRPPRRKLATQRRQHRVMAKLVVVDQVLVAQCDAIDPLTDQRRNLVLDQLRIAVVNKSRRKPIDQPDRSRGPAQPAAAFFAMAARFFWVRLSARARPPLRPPSLPRSAAGLCASSVIWPVAIRMTRTAFAATTAGRFWPLGPVGIQLRPG